MRVGPWAAAVLAGASLAAACLPAFATGPIEIVVNGATLPPDVAPLQQGGRLLVPARAVFSALGAFVDFDPATKTIFVVRPPARVVLHVGDAHALVNGSDVALDVPPQVIGGRTLVPLRFLGEALGANVQFDGAVSRVSIDLPGARPLSSSPGSARVLQIKSLSVDTHGKNILASGDALMVSLIGTPGATATFDLAGIATGVPLRELTGGAYTAFYVVPPGRNVNGVHVYGHLRDGDLVADKQSDSPLSIVGLHPVVRDEQPAPGTQTYVMQPAVAGFLDAQGGPGIDPQSVRLYLDDTDVTEAAGISGDRFYFTPYYPLAPGWHRVGVYAASQAGPDLSSEWAFYIIPTYPYSAWAGLPVYGNGFNFGAFGYNGYPVISLSTPAYGLVGAGASIPIVMIARAGGTALGGIEGAPGVVALVPVVGSPGYYVGRYVVPPNVDIARVTLMAQYFPPNGAAPVQIIQPTGLQIASTGLAHTKPLLVHEPATAPWVARVLPSPPVRTIETPPTIAPLPGTHANGGGPPGQSPFGAAPTPLPTRASPPPRAIGPGNSPGGVHATPLSGSPFSAPSATPSPRATVHPKHTPTPGPMTTPTSSSM